MLQGLLVLLGLFGALAIPTRRALPSRGIVLQQVEQPCPDPDVLPPPPLPDTFCPFSDPPQMESPVATVDRDLENRLVVTWKELSSEFNVSSYVLQQSIDGAAMETVFDGVGTKWETEFYTKHAKFQFWVKAINCASGSPWSNKTTLPAITIVDAPATPVVLNRTSTSLLVGWHTSVDNPLSMMVVQIRRHAQGPPPPNARGSDWDDWEDLLSGPTTVTQVTDLLPNVWYWFRVAYVDGENSRTWSSILATTTSPDVPHQPSRPRYTWAGRALKNIQVEWSCANDGGMPITDHILEAVSDADDDFIEVCRGTRPSCTVTLVPGRSYSLRATAVNALGTSETSDLLLVLCPPTVPDAPPMPTLVSKSLSSIRISWVPPAFDGGDDIVSYTLERGDGRALPFAQKQEGMIFDHESMGLFKSTFYRFRVRAFNSIGSSEYSQPLIVRTHLADGVCPGGEPSAAACFGHGTCDTDAQICPSCDPEWVLDDCSGKPCPNNCTGPSHGECDYSYGVCNCISPWGGLDCGRRDLSHMCPKCQHGTCNPSSGKCDCDRGFAGDACDEFDCLKYNQCNQHGKCVAVGVCLCDKGWLGNDCATATCARLGNCHGHGKCVAPDQCRCDAAYSGDDCSEGACPGDCNGHGQCLGVNTCSCDEGFAGMACERAVCPNDCSGHGSCKQPGACDCEDGWFGADCGSALCEAVNECGGHGNCTAPNNCTCEAAWTGPSCEDPACVDDCSNNGECIAYNLCRCAEGWSGETCALANCSMVSNCSGNGNCTRPGVCACEDGWGGVRCDEAKCDKVAFCSGHGRCVAPQKCECDGGFGGNKCDMRTTPTNCLLFNEQSDYLDFVKPLLNGLNQYTVEGWFNVSGVGKRINLIVQRDVLELYITHKLSASEIAPLDESGNAINPLVIHCVVTTSAGNVHIARQLSSPLRVFHFVSVSVDHSAVRLHVDGGLLGEAPTFSKESTTNALGSSAFGLTAAGGTVDPASSETPAIAVASLRLWNHVRSLEDVQASMLAGNQATDLGKSIPQNLIGFWRFEDKFGAQALNSVDNGDAGILVGSPAFALVKLPTVSIPTRPLMLEHEVLGEDTIRAMWEPPTEDGGATVFQYYLEFSVDLKSFDRVYVGPDLECEVPNLIPGHQYAFRVRAENFVGLSEFSLETVMSTKAGAPLAPRLAPVLAHASQTSLRISWVRAKSNGSMVTSYTIQYADSPTGTFVIGAQVSASDPRVAVINNLRPGVTHLVKVRATNEIGAGAWSPAAQMLTTSAEPERPQFAGTPTVAARSVSLAWVHPTDNGAEIEKYTIHRAELGAHNFSVDPQLPTASAVQVPANNDAGQEHEWIVVAADLAGNATTWKDELVNPATKYLYRLRAQNSIGPSNWTEIVALTEPTAPDAPTDVVVAEINQTTARVTWKAAAANGLTISSYNVEIASAQSINWVSKDQGDQPTAVLKDLEPDTTYSVRVSALNCKGWSTFSTSVVFASTAFTPKAPPSLFVRKVLPTSAVLSWTPPATASVSQFSFVVEAKTGELAWSEVYSGTKTDARINDLIPDTEYSFRVAAVNEVGIGDFGPVANTKTLPTGPAALSAPVVADVQASSVTVQWTNPAETEGTDATPPTTRLLISELSNPGAERVAFLGSKTTTATINNLHPQTTYRLRLGASNNAGAGNWSQTLTTTEASVPAQPLPPVVTSTRPAAIVLSWQDQPASVKDVQSWRLEVLDVSSAAEFGSHPPSEDFELVYSGPETSFRVSNLGAGHQYFFRVQGVNSVGSGPYSPVLSCSTSESPTTPPDSPQHVKLEEAGRTSITISWEGEADEFVVERTQRFPCDSQQDGTEQGWLQPPFESDWRSARLTDGADSLVTTEVYRGADTTTRITGLLAGSWYGIRVLAVNAAGSSAPSALLSFHTASALPEKPAKPYLVAATSTSISIAWDRPLDGCSPLQPFGIAVDTRATESSYQGHEATLQDLKPGVRYSIAVVAHNEEGEVVGESLSLMTLTDSPLAPVVRATVGDDSVTVSWEDAQTQGTPVTGYTVELSDPTTNAFAPVMQQKNVKSFVLSANAGLLSSKSYKARVFAHSTAGASGPSEEVEFRSPAAVPQKPLPPRVHENTAKYAALLWDRPLEEVDLSCELEVAGDVVYKGTDNNFLVSKLPASGPAVARVRCVNAKGQGPWSEPLEFEIGGCVGAA